MYSLTLYDKPLSSAALRAGITGIAMNWRRSIRWQGGAWQGSFVIRDKLSTLQDWFYNFLEGEIIEKVGGTTTWRGLVWEIDIVDHPQSPELRVKVLGRAHTLSWRYASAGDDSDDDISTWIDDIAAADCEFIDATRLITENTTQVRKATDIDQRAWDEMLRVTEMGDDSGNLYRLHMNNDNQLRYEKIDDFTPKYHAKGGLIRRRSLDTMWNHVTGT